MKQILGLLVAFFVLAPTAFAFLSNADIVKVTIAQPTSLNDNLEAGGTVLDESTNKLYSISKLERFTERTSSRQSVQDLFESTIILTTSDASTGKTLNRVELSPRVFSPNQKTSSWFADGLVLTPDKRLFGVVSYFPGGRMPEESGVFEFARSLSSTPNYAPKKLTQTTNVGYHGLAFYNGKLYSLGQKSALGFQKWFFAEIDPITGQSRELDADELYSFDLRIGAYHPRAFSVSPNGTFVTARLAHSFTGERILVYQLRNGQMQLIQNIKDNPLEKKDYYRGSFESVLAFDDHFVVGTSWGNLETFVKENGQFKAQPSERVALSTQRTPVTQLSFGGNRVISTLDKPGNGSPIELALVPVDASAPIGIEQPVLASKNPEILKEVDLKKPVSVELKPSQAINSLLAISFSFDQKLAQKITAPKQNQGKQPFQVIQENAVVKLNNQEIPEKFLVQENKFIFPQLQLASTNQPKTISITSKIPGYSGRGLVLEVDVTQQLVNDYKGHIRINLVANEETT